MNKLSVYISVIRNQSVTDAEDLKIIKSETRHRRKDIRLYETHYFENYYFNNGVIIQYEYYKYNPIGVDDCKVVNRKYRVIESNGLDFDRTTESVMY